MKRRYLLPAAALLLGTDSCSPVPPEVDPVVSSNPAAVARLRAKHADIIAILEKFEEANAEQPPEADQPVGRERNLLMTMAPDGNYFRQLMPVYLMVSGGESLLAGRLYVFQERLPGCEDDDYMLYEVEVSSRARPRRKPEPVQIDVAICSSKETESGHVVQILGEPPRQLDVPAIERLFIENLELIYQSVEDYAIDFEIEQHQILGEIMGCPSSTRFEHTSSIINPQPVKEYWCESFGLRHGPFIKGELDTFLNGVRLVEGHFDQGVRDGHWIYRNESGEITEESWWSGGVQVPAPDAP